MGSLQSFLPRVYTTLRLRRLGSRISPPAALWIHRDTGRRSVTDLAATATLRLRAARLHLYPQEGLLGASARGRSVRFLGLPASCHAT